MTYSFDELKQRSSDIEDWLKKEFSSIRTGKATPMILDGIRVDSYGSKMSINQLANISIEDPKTLRISTWDSTQNSAIEKAIQMANLGLSVTVDGKGLRVIFPDLTSERRLSLLKVAKQKLEEAMISLRLERERVWEDIQQKEKMTEITEDEKFRLKNGMQKLIDETNKVLDEVMERKEKEIMN